MSVLLIIITVVAAGVFGGYEYSKLRHPKYLIFDSYDKTILNSQFKKNKIDEPLLDVLMLEGVPILIGLATNEMELEKIKSIIQTDYPKYICLAEPKIIGGWNDQMANSLTLSLMLTLDISSRNYKIYVIKNIVWVVGFAHSEYEKYLLLEKIKNYDGVKTVKDYIIVRSNEKGYVVHSK